MGQGCHSAGVGPQEGRLWGDLAGVRWERCSEGPGWRFTTLSAPRVSGWMGWAGFGFDLDLVWSWVGFGFGFDLDFVWGWVWVGLGLG